MPRIIKWCVLAGTVLGILGGWAGLKGAQDALALQSEARQAAPELAQLSNRLSLQRSVASDGLGWIIIRGNTVLFYYLPGADLNKIERRLRNRKLPIAREYRDLFTNKSYPIENRISARLQFLLIRVKEILGMRPSIPSIDIKTFRNRDELWERYRQITGMHAKHKSFYVHSLSTIFTSEKDISDSIMAHEMAHSVMDYYFTVPPPNATAEFLAVHVDEHLDWD